MKFNLQSWAFIAFLFAQMPAFVFAEVKSNSPYIDQLKRDLEPDQETSESYTESIRKDLDAKSPAQAESQKSYTEILRLSDPEANKEGVVESYTELENAKLKPMDPGGAIQAVTEGKSELKMKKKGNIHHSFGFSYGLSLDYQASAEPGILQRNFKDIYGANYSPSLSFFYEFQPFHSEWFGNFGIIGMTGISYFHGVGAFSYAIEKPLGGVFPTTSDTKFQFFMIPVTVGMDYRFNLFRILRPYVMVGPTVLGYVEMRNDPTTGFRGNTRGLTMKAGASLLLDWFSSSSNWDMYSNYGIKHTYLTFDYTRFVTLGGDIAYTVSGALLGFSFEY